MESVSKEWDYYMKLKRCLNVVIADKKLKVHENHIIVQLGKCIESGYQHYDMFEDSLCDDILKRAPKNLSSNRLYHLCCNRNWFTDGDTDQYQKLFALCNAGAGLDTLATVIWLCSTNATREEILATLKEEAMR